MRDRFAKKAKRRSLEVAYLVIEMDDDNIKKLLTCYTTVTAIYDFVNHQTESNNNTNHEKLDILRIAATLRHPLHQQLLLHLQNSENLYTQKEEATNTLHDMNQIRREYNIKNDQMNACFNTCTCDIKQLNYQLNDIILQLNTGIPLDLPGFINEQHYNSKQIELINHIHRIEQGVRSTLGQSIELCNLYLHQPARIDFDDERAKLGSGSFGIIYRKQNAIDRELYAVKVIPRDDRPSKGQNNNILNDKVNCEARFLQMLSHPNIVRYFASFKTHDDSRLNIVMELVDGSSLARYTQNTTATTAADRPSKELITKWLLQTLRALQYLHDDMHILHRDIKPDNILITSLTQSIKLIDLGSAGLYSPASPETKMTGTSLYGSYEKMNEHPYDGRDDVWAVGCVWSELLTGVSLQHKPALHRCDPVSRLPNLISACKTYDNHLGTVIASMLQARQEQRSTASNCLTQLSLASKEPTVLPTCTAPHGYTDTPSSGSSSTTEVDSPYTDPLTPLTSTPRIHTAYNSSIHNNNTSTCIRYEGGHNYEGQVRDGKRHGRGVMTYTNGDRFSGIWAEDRFIGTTTTTGADEGCMLS